MDSGTRSPIEEHPARTSFGAACRAGKSCCRRCLFWALIAQKPPAVMDLLAETHNNRFQNTGLRPAQTQRYSEAKWDRAKYRLVATARATFFAVVDPPPGMRLRVSPLFHAQENYYVFASL